MRDGMRIITLEEHFATADYRKGEGGAFDESFAASVAARIADIEDHRLPEMDATGVDVQVLSLTTPGVQGEVDADLARERAVRSNDSIAEAASTHPDRFRFFAAVSTLRGSDAVAELQRAVGELGAVGALVNGQSAGRYLDHPDLDDFWAAAEELGVPVYLHPAFPHTPFSTLDGYPELAGPMWGWGFETASHALRLVLGGVFDRHPEARLVLGHMGEGLPFTFARLDDRYSILQHSRPLEHAPSHYLRKNVIVTTAGVESAAPLHATVAEVGVDNVLFSVDYPYQSIRTATEFIATVALDEADRRAIVGGNAARLLGVEVAERA